MKRFHKLVKVGTKVLVKGNWHKVEYVSDRRLLIKIEGLCGHFQAGHVEKFRNN